MTTPSDLSLLEKSLVQPHENRTLWAVLMEVISNPPAPSQAPPIPADLLEALQARFGLVETAGAAQRGRADAAWLTALRARLPNSWVCGSLVTALLVAALLPRDMLGSKKPPATQPAGSDDGAVRGAVAPPAPSPVRKRLLFWVGELDPGMLEIFQNNDCEVILAASIAEASADVAQHADREAYVAEPALNNLSKLQPGGALSNGERVRPTSGAQGWLSAMIRLSQNN